MHVYIPHIEIYKSAHAGNLNVDMCAYINVYLDMAHAWL